MAVTDASIPLSFNPSAQVGPDLSQYFKLAEFGQQLKLRQKQMQAQATLERERIAAQQASQNAALSQRAELAAPGNALKMQELRRNQAVQDIFSAPGNVDDQGNLTPTGRRSLYAADPELGMKYKQNQLVQQEQAIRSQHLQSETFQTQYKMLGDVQSRALATYEDAVENGHLDPQEAQRRAQAVQDEGFNQLRQGGMFSSQQQQSWPKQFDPVQARGFVMGQKDYLDYMKKKRDEERADRRLDEAGWQVLTDPGTKDAQGNPVQYRYNPRTTQATTLTGEPYTPTGASKIGTSDQGKVMSDDATQFVVDRVVAGDPDATKNMSRSQANMTKVENELGRRYRAGQLDAGQLSAATAVVRADRSSLGNLTKMTDAAVSFEATASRNFDLALKQAPKAIPTNWGPWLNKWVMNGERALGDPDVPAYVAAILTGANEYAKIMAGSTGAQGSTVDSRREAAEMFSPYLAKGQIEAVVRIAKQDMANRKAALGAQLETIRGRIAGQSATNPPPPAAGEASTGPTPGGGALPQANRGYPKPKPGAIDLLKSKPELAPQFDQLYGQGASKQYLGGQ